jgi:trigger factor
VRHDFEVSLRPELQLGAYKGLTYEAQVPPISDQEVEAAIARALQQNARLEPAGEDGLPPNGMALCKVVLSAGGEVVLEREGLRLSPNVPLPGVEPNAYREALTGARDGERRELALTFPADFEQESVRGQEGRVEISVLQAFKVVVPGREQLIASLEGVSDEAGLLAKARESLEQARAAEERRQQESELLGKVIESHAVELSASMLDDQLAARVEVLKKELAAQGLAAAAIEEEVSNQSAELRRQAERGAKAYFLVEAIAEKEGLEVTAAELEAEYRAIAERNQAQVAEVKAYYQEQRLVSQLVLEIVERKVRAFLWEQATPAGAAKP